MTSLNNRLQLALLNRKKGNNALEKGFTLVELMIVIVIVGILSAVALPNFLSQTEKARMTEARTQAKAFLTNYHLSELDGTQADALKRVTSDGACPVDTTNFTYTCTAGQIVASGAAGSLTATVDSSGVISGI